jgi:PST family polysaccharide transporter
VLPFQILSLGVFFRTGYRFASSLVMATGHVFALSICQAIYAVLVVAGAIVGSAWGVAGVATATLGALLVFYLLLYTLASRVNGMRASSLLSALAKPSLVFITTVATSGLARYALLRLEWPPIAVLVGAVVVSLAALLALTIILREKLWGRFLYEQVTGLKRSEGTKAASE